MTERSAEDLATWKRSAAESVRLWTAFRDARCDARLIGYETRGAGDAAACRMRITSTIVDDLKLRYWPERPGARARASAETRRASVASPPSPDEAGPCAKAPPAECDYCGMNRCWERRLKAADGRLNAAWRRALASIQAKRKLSVAERSD